MYSEEQVYEALTIVSEVCHKYQKDCLNCPYWLEVEPDEMYCVIDMIADPKY